jgi:RHS repeat-associated protein
MRFLLVLLSLVLQVNVSGYNINIPTENCVQKTLTSENSEINGRSYVLFRYYDCDIGSYISQDPIGLNGGATLYAYVHDPNSWIDLFGLRGKESFPSWMPTKTGYERHHIIPYEHRSHEVFKIQEWM